MSNDPCEQVRPILADYADGELAAEEAQRVEAHLDTCGACRRELAALRRSLALARQVWQASAEETAARPARRRRPAGVPTVAAAAAACFLLAAGVAVTVWLTRRGPGTVATGRQAPAMSLQEVHRLIQREVLAARLLASAEILAAQPGGEAEGARTIEHVIQTYGDTSAVKQRRAPPTRDQGDIR